MRLIAAALVFAAFAAAPAAAGDRARLQLVRVKPLTVHGMNFKSHERVGVVVRRPAGTARRSVGADADGAFSVSFRDVSIGRCTGFSIVAIGSKGSRAAFLWRAAECAAT